MHEAGLKAAPTDKQISNFDVTGIVTFQSQLTGLTPGYNTVVPHIEEQYCERHAQKEHRHAHNLPFSSHDVHRRGVPVQHSVFPISLRFFTTVISPEGSGSSLRRQQRAAGTSVDASVYSY
jgi:hypothetical protein